MIAYNKQWLNNLLVRQEAGKAFSNHCIAAEEKQLVYTAYPENFYNPNFFVRVGLIVLTVIIVSFSVGFFALFLMDNVGSAGGFFVFFGLIIYGALELMVKRNHYKSGVDDALMWMAAGNIIGGLNGIADLSPQTNAFIVLLISVFLFARFANAIMAAIAAVAVLAFIFLTLAKLAPGTKVVMPFILMACAALIYFFAKKRLKHNRPAYYNNGWLLIAITALVSLYAAGNYFVVREASVAMFNLDLSGGKDIPFGWLFWIFTAGIPVLYMAKGIQKKDAVLLRVGLLLVAAVVCTVRNYYHLVPIEITMVIAGVVFIAISYGLMKYLHEPRHGFTQKEQNDGFFMDKLQVESLVIAQTFSGPGLPADGGTQFGGGTGGGGGASGQF